MAIEGKVRTLYTDKTQQEAIFPTTKVSAVTDDEGNGLNTLLEHIAYVDPTDMESAAVLANADLLGGYPANDYVLVEDLKKLKPEDIGAAPGGYGLGTEPKFITDANDATLPGFYAPNGISCANIPNEWQFLYGTIIVSRGAGLIEQLFLARDMSAKRTCYYASGEWFWCEWEYINPPMAFDVEYRTTERWNGYPVYTKMVDMGAIPNNTNKSVQIMEHNGRVIDAYGIENRSGQKLPTAAFGANFNYRVELPFSGKTLTMISNFDGSQYTQCYIIVKYIKY